jgi:hypothetical protein
MPAPLGTALTQALFFIKNERFYPLIYNHLGGAVRKKPYCAIMKRHPLGNDQDYFIDISTGEKVKLYPWGSCCQYRRCVNGFVSGIYNPLPFRLVSSAWVRYQEAHGKMWCNS